ncbi:LysE family transporter [Mangrovicella endophytica]|uniref:LysE family transporter n=1 Tax=Mangrovicella endophytica TaxID=2066697 RepID=UPI000C9DDC62|nr:LysE family transporter [Mangrovicella endophytica]
MLEPFLPLLLFTAVATLSPGGASALVTASGAHFGYRRSLPLIAGIALGLASMGAAAAAGLGAVIEELPALQLAIKAVGSLYLAWLALQLALGGPPHLNRGTVRPTRFAAGVWLVWHNPKGWAMTTGAAASFVALADGPGRLSAILGITFGVAAAISLTLWCIAGLLLARLLRRDWQWRVVNVALALLLLASIVPMWLD